MGLDGSRQAHVFRELRYLKFKRHDIQALVEVFGIDTLERHIAWLPERTTRPDARALVKALINEKGRPRRLRDVLDRYVQKKERLEYRRSDRDVLSSEEGEYE